MTWTRSDTSRRSSWTKTEIRDARKQMLKPILEHLGYRLTLREQENYLVLNLSGRVIIKGSYWINKEDESSGNAIDFFMKLCGKSFSETMEILTIKN